MEVVSVIREPKGKLAVPVKCNALNRFEMHACTLYRVYLKYFDKLQE
jgi:hypothetical protein